MKRTLQFFAGFLLIFTATTLLAQMHYNYNTGGSNNAFPFNTLPATGKTIQHLYLPGDFNNPTPVSMGNITKIYFRAGTSSGNATYTNLKIRMGLTTDTDLPAGAWYTGSMTVVYDEANVNLIGTTGTFFSITLETPFLYDPTKSLVVEIEQCGYSGTGIPVYTTSTSGNKRHTSLASNPTSCPHQWLNTGAFLTHTGIDVEPAVVNCSYSWGPQVSGITTNFFSVKAVNGLVAWASGAGAVVRKTTDGGVTWTNANPNPGVITGDVYNIEAIDANNAWCTTSPGATFIYKTTNGGTNWVQVFTQAAPSFINAIKMTSATNGIATGDVVSGTWVILGTTDGGSTWTPISSPAGTGDGRNNCLQVTGTNVWFGTGQGTMWRSTNSGVNWANSPTAPLTTQVLSVRFNGAIGLAGGSSMVRSTDGGVTWAAVTAPGTGNISGIDGSGSDFWYVRGTGIYRSTDNGLTFTQVHTATGTQVDIKLANGPNGCLVGWSVASGGNIAKMNGVPVGIGNNNNEIPSNYLLEQNYPNPFNPVTNINFSIPKAGFTELKVYDAIGREVAVLYSAQTPAGNHTVKFDAAELSSGVYFYTIKSGEFTATKKMALIK
jgi:photosystem II stability/assembly factor-like uncharacterized protein